MLDWSLVGGGPNQFQGLEMQELQMAEGQIQDSNV